MTQQDLQIIRTIMREELQHIDQRLDGIDERLDGIDERLDGIDERLDRLEEGQDELRSSINILVEWADKTAGAVGFPLPELLEG